MSKRRLNAENSPDDLKAKVPKTALYSSVPKPVLTDATQAALNSSKIASEENKAKLVEMNETVGNFNAKLVTEEDIKRIRSSVHKQLRLNVLPDSQDLQVQGLEKQRAELYSILMRTMTNADNSSILLQGKNGSGKSFVLEHVLRSLKNELHKTNMVSVVQVRLNGVLHADEVDALASIQRQLSDVPSLKKPDITNSMEYIREILRQTKVLRVPVIFILDHMEGFVSRTRQTLLYNLFDLLQDASVQMSIICSCANLLMENKLEKRIRSRSEFRRIQFGTIHEETLFALVKDFFSRVENDSCDESKSQIQFRQTFVKSSLSMFTKLYSSKKPNVISVEVDIGRSVPWYFTALLLASTRLTPSHPFLTDADFIWAWEQQSKHCRPRNNLSYLFQCSVIEISLLLAMVHLERKEIITYNFELIWDEFERARKQVSGMMFKVTVESARVAFEKLLDLQLVSYLDRDHGKEPISVFSPARMAVDPSIIADYVKKHCLQWLQDWEAEYVTS